MATYKSRNIYKAHRARPVYDGKLHSITGSITIPSGTLIEDNSVIRLFRFCPGSLIVTRTFVDISAALDGHATPASRTLVGTLGLLKSADRAGTNLSYKLSATTTAADEDTDFLLAAAAIPEIDPGTVDEFGTAGDGSLINVGGFHVYSGPTAAGGATGMNLVTADSRGYDANVMDVAITFTEPSSTAMTADSIITVTLEVVGVPTAPSSTAPYLYADRYNSSGVGTF